MKRWLIPLFFLAALTATSQSDAGYRYWCRRPIAACYPPVAVYPVPVYPAYAAYRFPVPPVPVPVPVPAYGFVGVPPVPPAVYFRWNYYGPRYYW